MPRFGIGLPDIPGISEIAGILGIGDEESRMPWGPASPVTRAARDARAPKPKSRPKQKPKRKPKKNPVRSKQNQVPDIGMGGGLVPTGPVDWTDGYVLPPPAAPTSPGKSAQGGRPFGGMNPNVGSFIPLGRANRGAQPMTKTQIEQLIASLVGGQYSSQADIMSQERARMEGQNRMNLQNIRGWYDQVLGSQGVAAQRDEAFGKAAVDSTTEATARIVSALGGEANQGSYVAGAAGQENVGNIQAIGTIQNEYNADMAPLLQAEAAGQLAREQAMGSSRSRDLAMRLAELQSDRSTAEADLRFKLWQSNNQILDQRLQNELSIRQLNSGTQQQRYNNRLGLMQAKMAYDASVQQGLIDSRDQSFEEWYKAQGLALEGAKINQRGALSQQDNATRVAIAQGQEAGRNYRAQLAARSGGSGSQKDILRLSTSENGREGFMEAIFQAIPEGTSLQQAQQIAIAVTRGMGLPVKNRAVQGLLVQALYEAGYDIN